MVSMLIKFRKEYGVYSKQQKLDMDLYPDEEEMEDLILDDERQHHWRMVFKDNDGGVDDVKKIMHAKKQDFYINKNRVLINGEYSV